MNWIDFSPSLCFVDCRGKIREFDSLLCFKSILDLDRIRSLGFLLIMGDSVLLGLRFWCFCGFNRSYLFRVCPFRLYSFIFSDQIIWIWGFFYERLYFSLCCKYDVVLGDLSILGRLFFWGSVGFMKIRRLFSCPRLLDVDGYNRR